MDFLRRLFSKHSWVRKVWYWLKAVSAALWYRFPARHYDSIIGITGTDGKTTTVEMISAVLREAGIHHIKISTDSFFIDGRYEKNTTKRTTLSPWQTQTLLTRGLKTGAAVAVLEVSSHAVDQHRLWGVSFDVAGITNITPEHLEDHGGMENYVAAKKKFFTNLLRGSGTAVLNAEDDRVALWENDISARKIWVSQDPEKTSYPLQGIETTATETHFLLGEHEITLAIPGIFHVWNAAIAFFVLHTLGIPVEIIQKGLHAFHGVPGRLEKLNLDQKFSVYVDDAVTPNAFQRGLESLRKITSGHIWVVFGLAGGGRDKGTRPEIGSICGDLADFVILTDDEPHTEPPESIRADIKKGLAETNVWNQGDDSPHFWEIPDRRAAIEFALQSAQEGDAILIPGLGSYETRSIGGKEVPWSDRAVVREILGLKEVHKEVEQKQTLQELEGLRQKVIEQSAE